MIPCGIPALPPLPLGGAWLRAACRVMGGRHMPPPPGMTRLALAAPLTPAYPPERPCGAWGWMARVLGSLAPPRTKWGAVVFCALWSYDLQPPIRAPVRDAPLRGGKVRPLRGPPLWGGRKAGQIFASPLCDPRGSKGQRCRSGIVVSVRGRGTGLAPLGLGFR